MRRLKIGSKTYTIGKQTIIMGILNVTPDSFSDGGRFTSVEKAVRHAVRMEEEGADIIDIGGESTRPGAQPITLEEELNRVIPVIKKLTNEIDIPISIDTYKSEIARKALDLGADMVNDITAFQGDKNLVSIVSEYDVPVCLMHIKGNPRNMQINPVYDDVVKEIYEYLQERSEYALLCNVKKEKIILDPGLGFGKRTGRGVEDNCEIIYRLNELKELDYPILVGPSRKKFIGNICGDEKPLPVSERLEGSLAACSLAVSNGADIVRVHDVKETRRCVDLVDSVVR